MHRYSGLCLVSPVLRAVSCLVVKRRAHRHPIRTSTSCYKHYTAVHASTVLVQLAGEKLCFTDGKVQNMFGSLSASDSFCFAVVAQNITDPHPRHYVPFENHAFACLGNSSISHTQISCKFGRGALTQKRIGGPFTVGFGRFPLFSFDSRAGVYSGFWPLSLKYSAPGRIPRGGVYPHHCAS